MLLGLVVVDHVLVPHLHRDAGAVLWLLLHGVLVPGFCVLLLVAFTVAVVRTGRVVPHVAAALVAAVVLWLAAVPLTSILNAIPEH
jgi:hypothetical protein